MFLKKRKMIIGCHWNSSQTFSEATNFINENLNNLVFDQKKLEILMTPIFLHIPSFKATNTLQYSHQQSIDTNNEKTFDHLLSLGVKWVVLGNLQCRQYYAETNEDVASKVVLALKKGFNVIACIGETLAQRKTHQTFNVCKAQLDALQDQIILNQLSWDNLIISYDPLWAGGTEKTINNEQVKEMQAYIREYLKEFINEEVSIRTRILYGGSVSEAKSSELMELKDIDGFLIGTATISKTFQEIIKNCSV